MIMNCLYSSLVYPFYTMYEFPDPFTVQFIMLWIMEGFFAIDIILNFFK